MRKRHLFSVAAVTAGLSTAAFAQTVSVDATNGSPDNSTTFSSLMVAISSFQAGGAVTAATDGSGVGVNHGNAAADVINITSVDKIEEIVRIDDANTDLDEALTINGPGATSGHVAPSALANAVVAPQDGGDGDAFLVNSDQDITVNNVTFIPAATTGAADDLLVLRITGAGPNTLRFAGCVATFPTVGGAPVVNSKAEALTDQKASIDDTAAGDDLVNIAAAENQALSVEFVDCVLSHGKSTGDAIVEVAGSADATNHSTATRSQPFTLTLESTIISYIGRYGVQLAGDGDSSAGDNWNLVITGSNVGDGPVDAVGGPSMIFGCANHALISFLGPATGTANVDNLIIAGNATRAWSGDSDLQEVSVSDAMYMQLDEDAGGATVELAYVQDGWEGQVPHSFQRVTIVGESLWGDPIDTGTAPVNTFRDCIFAGNGGNPFGTLYSGNYVLDVDFSAVVEAGPNAALVGYTANPGYTPGTNIITDDPQFASMDPLSADFLDVTNSAYATAGTGGSALSGGSDYSVASSVDNWFLIER
ncbi:MAG: hypothetical protein PWP23_3383 [Candidatus Sumerlaeota bacterium]|nr:hypothetical protein [Candidatus Sumerlaeota bacterium]